MRKSYWLLDTRLSVLASAAETGGRYDLVEGWFPVGAQVPLHRHGRYSEQLYVLDGEFTVWTSRHKTVLRPGDDLAIPAGTAHALAVTGDGPGRAIVVASPSGFARLITEVGTPTEGDQAPPPLATDMDLLFRLSAELGDEILGPPGALPD
jgi:quercetin dioxygenase-like cupin family protein